MTRNPSESFINNKRLASSLRASSIGERKAVFGVIFEMSRTSSPPDGRGKWIKFLPLLLIAAVACLAGWKYASRPNPDDLDPRNPVVLTMWHNPSGQMKHAMSDVVDEFNRTAGKEKGIVIAVTSIGKFEVLHEKLQLLANGDPGAPEAPDIAMAYPKSAILLVRKDMLVDFDDYFTKDELSAFVPRFLEEGRISDGKLYIFPTGKSTEGLLVNRTLFDRFAKETGASLGDLATVEGILATAKKYYGWTDAKTPDVPWDGKMFFMIDNPINFAQVGFRQMGGEFLSEAGMNLRAPLFEKIWNAYYEPAVRGQEAIYDGYGTDLTKTGDIVCWTSSTAGISFLPASMTYADNSSEPVEFDFLPYPVYEGGKKVAIQRAGGFCLLKSTPKKERAAILFLKWLVEPEQNLRFLKGTGYLPVTREAMEKAEHSDAEGLPPIHRRFLEVVTQMGAEYDFLIPKNLDNFGTIEIAYESALAKCASEARGKFEKRRGALGTDEAYRAATEGAYEDFVESLR